jgi:DDE domain
MRPSGSGGTALANVGRRDSQETSRGYAGLSALALALGRGVCEDHGKLYYLWRAVDHESEVLEAVVTATRDKVGR